MNKINWVVRIKNKTFWLALIPAVLLLIQVVAVSFGYNFKIEPLNTELLNIVNAIFVILSILGIVTDHTTTGLSDSPLVMTKTKPSDTETNHSYGGK